jgi:hypothetical protein
MISGDSDDGPMVQTIFVLFKGKGMFYPSLILKTVIATEYTEKNNKIFFEILIVSLCDLCALCGSTGFLG